MQRHSFFALSIFSIFAVLLPAHALAQPLILTEPIDRSAYLGTSDANVTFAVVASDPTDTTVSSLTYQWNVSTDGGATFNPLSDTTTYNGSITPNLTINCTDSTLTGFKYACVVSGAGGSPVTTFAPALSVYTPTLTTPPVVTVNSNQSIAANSTANISINITGIPTGDQVKIQRYLDANGNGNVDVGEQLVQNFFVTDGTSSSFGSVADPFIPGDDDGAADGNISTHINLNNSPELGQVAGTYIIKVSSPTGDFTPVTATLTVTQPSYDQSISGQVTDGTSPIPYAGVAILTGGNGNNQFVAGTLADANGNYTLNAPDGSYVLIGLKPGYVFSFENAPSIDLTSCSPLTGENLTLTPPTVTITGKIKDSINPNKAVAGVELFAESSGGYLALLMADNNGHFDVPVIADSQWAFDISSSGLAATGYIRPSNKPEFDTSAGSPPAGTIVMTPVNALIYGTVTDTNSKLLPNVIIEASDNNNNYTTGNTDSSGNYYLGVYGPVSGSPSSWYVDVDTSDPNPGFAGYVPPSGQNANLNSNTAAQVNFAALAVTAYLNGTVSTATLDNNGNPIVGCAVPGAVIDAFLQNNNSGGANVQMQTTTDSNGNFSLGVAGGNWTVQLDEGTGNNNQVNNPNVIGQSTTYTVIDGTNITNINYLELAQTSSITGNMVDVNDIPVTSNSISATSIIGGINYATGGQTDSNGNFVIPVVNGVWNVSPNQGGYLNQNVTVFNNSPAITFVQSIINQQPNGQTVILPATASFTVNTASTTGTPTFQWQLSTDNGNTWNNVVNNSTNYNGNTTQNLSVSNTTAVMNGYQYRLVINYVGIQTTSSAANLNVEFAPSIGTQPIPATIFAGQNTSFSVVAGGNPAPTYQWESTADSGCHWTMLADNSTYSGSTNSQLNVNTAALGLSGTEYRCILNNLVTSTDTNMVRLSVDPSFYSWQQSNFSAPQLSNSNISGAYATPAGDGIPNLVKYGLGLTPFAEGQASLPKPTVVSDVLTLTFQGAQADLNYTVEVSTDLQNWTTTNVVLQKVGSTYTATYNLNGQPLVFMRIVVQGNQAS